MNVYINIYIDLFLALVIEHMVEPREVSIVLPTSPMSTFSRSLMQRPSNFLRLGRMVLRGQAAGVCGFILLPKIG